MSNWGIKCPHCGEVINSNNSYADTKIELRIHIEMRHPDEDPNGV